MSSTLVVAPQTLRESFSFYVGSSSAERIQDCEAVADAVVVSGPNGPTVVRRLRATGWKGSVLFDCVSYDQSGTRPDALHWFDEQISAGADRVLTPGVWVGSEKNHAPFSVQIEDEANLANSIGATCLIAIDRHWFTRSDKLSEIMLGLGELNTPCALVLGDGKDPMGYAGAVDALASISRNIRDVSVIRCDQAGIGALAFGATHASIGLRTLHRHVVPPNVKSFAKYEDRSARVFVRELLDWFTASRIAEWSSASVSPHCYAACCEGRPIARFLDSRLKTAADLHNRVVLANLANDILDAPVEDGVRRREFGRICAEAVQRYGTMGSHMTLIKPKKQLTQWALFC